MTNFTAAQIQRYNRQIIMPGFGLAGQERLRQGKVLIVGTGGLGSPAAIYLAAAGIGTLGLVDNDRVDLSNLQRQILHNSERLGRFKVESARETLNALNPDVQIKIYPERLTGANIKGLIQNYDLIINCVDNFATRYLLNDACVLAGKPLVEAGISQWEGMIMTIKPGEGPCYRCIFPEKPLAEADRNAGQRGVIGVTPGLLGVLQAAEALKILLGQGQPLIGRLLLVGLLEGSFREVQVERNPRCPVCGDEPAITSLEDNRRV